MWSTYEMVVRQLRPRIVLLENVPDMARWDDGAVIDGLHAMLRDLGYEPESRVLESNQYGVPQHRARLIVVALRTGSFTWPKRRRPVTVRDAIADLPRVAGDQRREKLRYRGAATDFQRRARRGIPAPDKGVVYDHITRGVRSDDLAAYRLMKPGATYKSLPPELQRYRTDIYSDKYKRLEWDHVSRTITAHIAKDGYWYIHPRDHRTLSIREAARLQTFPDWFRFAGHPSAQFRQIGNAVPPALAYAVARRVVAALQTTGRVSRLPFARRLRHAWAGEIDLPPNESLVPWHQLVYTVCFGMRTRSDAERRLAEIRSVARTPTMVADDLAPVARLLGSYDRAERVLALATAVLTKHGGSPPRTERELRSLPHVTDYMAAALSASLLGNRAVVVNAGTKRIASRVLGRPSQGVWGARLDLLQLAGPDGPTPLFNADLRRLASEICTAAPPDCPRCPVIDICATANRRSMQADRRARKNRHAVSLPTTSSRSE
jgi:DNA (cytosine-5)-methyltransferase 1